jgi:hypothetical protein
MYEATENSSLLGSVIDEIGYDERGRHCEDGRPVYERTFTLN